MNQRLTRTSETIKEEYLRKKYVKKMEQAFSSKKVKTAREMRLEGFAEMERLAMVEERRRSQASADVEEISKAVRESEAIKAQIEADERKKKAEAAVQVAKVAKAAKASQIVGKKRKSDASEETIETRLDLAGRPYIPRHKRSKTEVHVDSDYDSGNVYKRHQVRHTHTRQQQVGRSLFSRSISNYSIRRASESLTRGSIDTTKTDYFKLKALGINPDTPIIPLTANQLKQQREQVEAEKSRRAAEPKPWEGNSTSRSLSSDLKLSGFDMPPPAKPLPKPLLATKKSQTTTTSSVNDLLNKLKKYNEAQTAQTEWFKARREELEKLEDQVEEQVQVHQTIERRDSSQSSYSSLMRSSLGYNFIPAENKPGQTLSRTEQRIRRTGAHGLAIAPIGGTPGYVKPEVSYLERQLKSSLNGAATSERDGATLNGIPSQVRQHGDESHPAPASKNNGKGKERAIEDERHSANHYSNGYAYPQLGYSITNPGSDFESDDTEELYQQKIAQNALQEDGQFSEGSYADDYGEEDFNEDEDLGDYDEEEDEGDDEEQAGPSHRGQYLSATPDAGGQTSRGASSGAGASVEDAIDLDSD